MFWDRSMKSKVVEAVSPLVVVPEAVVIKTRSLCVDNLPPLWEESTEFEGGEAGIPQAIAHEARELAAIKTRSLFAGKLPLRSALVGYIPVRLDLAAAPTDSVGTPPNLPERIAVELRDQEARRAHDGTAAKSAKSELQSEWEQLQQLCAEARLALSPRDADAGAASTAEPRIPAREDMEQAREALGKIFEKETRDVPGRKGKEAAKHKITAVAKAGLGHVGRHNGSKEEVLQRKKNQIMHRLSLNCCSGTPEEVEKSRRLMIRELSQKQTGKNSLISCK